MGKRILMVLEQEFPPDDRVYKEAQSLLTNGFVVTILCITNTGKPFFEQYKGIDIYRKKLPKLIYKSSVAALKSNIYFNWWKRCVSNLLKENKFDIIHIHDLPLAEVGVYFKKHNNMKLVVDLHENWPAHISKATHTNTALGKMLSSEKQWRKYESNILKDSDLIVTVVKEMKSRIANLGNTEDKICVLQNTIIPDEYPNLQQTKDTNHFTLFFAGGINIERGLQYVIPALKLIKKDIPNIKLKIVGKGRYLSVLEHLVEDNDLQEYVEFMGWKPLSEVLVLTAQADVTLIPHLKWEQTDCSSPNKLFQCMLAGVPLLVSNCDSVARIVEETNSGLVYEYDNINAFATKLISMFNNAEQTKQMGINGTNAVLTKYNWQNSSTEFIAAYKNL